MHKKRGKKPYKSIYHELGLQDVEESKSRVLRLILFREAPGSLCIQGKKPQLCQAHLPQEVRHRHSGDDINISAGAVRGPDLGTKAGIKRETALSSEHKPCKCVYRGLQPPGCRQASKAWLEWRMPFLSSAVVSTLLYH